MARVLLADDEASVRDLIRHGLAADGHEVTAAQDGQEALDLVTAASAPFDVLVTDIQMPGMDGLTLAVRASELVPRLKVVLMSAYIDQVEVPARLKPFLVKVLAKPLALEEARAAVKAALA